MLLIFPRKTVIWDWRLEEFVLGRRETERGSLWTAIQRTVAGLTGWVAVGKIVFLDIGAEPGWFIFSADQQSMSLQLNTVRGICYQYDQLADINVHSNTFILSLTVSGFARKNEIERKMGDYQGSKWRRWKRKTVKREDCCQHQRLNFNKILPLGLNLNSSY